MDLFEIQVPENKLHPNFIHLSKDEELVETINSWKIGFEDRDNKFAKEFQTTFNTAFWELYLHTCFKQLGFKIDYSNPSPDFQIKTRKKKTSIIVEAVTTRNAEGERPEHERKDELKDLELQFRSKNITIDHTILHNKIVEVATERIANSISTKVKKYKQHYSKLDHVKDKPFILAIGAFEQSFFYLQGTAAIERVLYGLTKAKYEGKNQILEYSDHILKNKNGSKIPIGIFNNEDLSCISGILFSPVATVGKLRVVSKKKFDNILIDTVRYNDYGQKSTHSSDTHDKYTEGLLDGMSLYLNPYADHPIDTGEFDDNNIAKIYNNNERSVKHGFLFSRVVINQQFRE